MIRKYRSLFFIFAGITLFAATTSVGPATSEEPRAGSDEAPVTYIFEGKYDGAMRINVTDGNDHTKDANLNNKTVTFKMEPVLPLDIDVNDTNNDGYFDYRDLRKGDKVRLKTDMAKDPGGDPYEVRTIEDFDAPRPYRF